MANPNGETTVEVENQLPIGLKAPEYARVYFDNLYGEYSVMKEKIDNKERIKERLEALHKKRDSDKLTWGDVYEFDLLLLDAAAPKDLVRKAYDMRSRYRSISGSRDYDAYIASKPPDLSTIDSEANANAQPDAPVLTVEALRADIRYLLKQFYLYYALLPQREGLRDLLTKRARNLTLFFVLLIIAAIGLGYGIKGTSTSVAVVVILAGTIGGCVSMLQRIQSAPSEGDAIYNLASLEKGWTGISLSPLYGAIFAMVLFVLFSAGILRGTVFPVIRTIRDEIAGSAQAGTQSASATKKDDAVTQEGSPTPVASPANAQEPAKKPDEPRQSLSSIPFTEFLGTTYPERGIDYALLIVWSFIAGFAERLVPDTLNRLVAKNQSIQGNNG
jgi:hypothetical protein